MLCMRFFVIDIVLAPQISHGETNLAAVLELACVVLAMMQFVFACESCFMEFVDPQKWL